MSATPTDSQPPDATLLQSRRLVEYQKAQDSAQHHDTLAASTISTFLGASLVLLGFVVNNLQRRNELRVILTILGIVAVLITIAIWINAFLFNSIKRQKYRRCQALEDPLGFEQHRTLRYPQGIQRVVLSIVLAMLLVAWAAIILFANDLCPFR